MLAGLLRACDAPILRSNGREGAPHDKVPMQLHSQARGDFVLA